MRRHWKVESHCKSCAISLPIYSLTHPSVWLDVVAVGRQSSTLQKQAETPWTSSAIGHHEGGPLHFTAIRINGSQEKDASAIKISEGEKSPGIEVCFM